MFANVFMDYLKSLGELQKLQENTQGEKTELQIEALELLST